MACCGQGKTPRWRANPPDENRPEELLDNIRESCLECVEKHIGAASVLASEIADGYPEHRLLLIGHLYEAADEARDWPELQKALVNARRRFQREKVAPDLPSLAKLAESVRKSQ